MHYVITFVANTAAYRAHAETCPAAKTTRSKVRLDQIFGSVVGARAWADHDESNKAGEPAKANFKACACTLEG